MAEEAEARLADLLDDGGGAVGGAVIDNEDFGDARALVGGAGDGFGDEFSWLNAGMTTLTRAVATLPGAGAEAGGTGLDWGTAFIRGLGVRAAGPTSGS